MRPARRWCSLGGALAGAAVGWWLAAAAAAATGPTSSVPGRSGASRRWAELAGTQPWRRSRLLRDYSRGSATRCSGGAAERDRRAAEAALG